jgi:hypothetical protein
VRKLGRAKAPERLQLVDALPRRADGSVRTEILQLDRHEPARSGRHLIATRRAPHCREIIADRRNLRDRFTSDFSPSACMTEAA